jgi:hypothetical protein
MARENLCTIGQDREAVTIGLTQFRKAPGTRLVTDRGESVILLAERRANNHSRLGWRSGILALATKWFRAI